MNAPLTPEVIVNNITALEQIIPRVATLSDGTYYVVWQSNLQDGDDPAIIAQRFSAAGERIGNEVIVNTRHTDFQNVPAIAATDDGGFVVVWQGYNQDVPGTSDYGVFGQRFSADGNKLGDEFQVNAVNITNTQFAPEAIGLPGGGFAITFTDDRGDGSVDGIRVRFYDAAGVPAGDDVQVNTETSSDQEYSAIAAIQPSGAANGLAAGGVVIVWTSEQSGTAGDGSGDGVFAQILGVDGVPIGTEFQVNTTTNSTQADASIVGLAGGRFVIVWEDGNGLDGSGAAIVGQVYEGDGTPVGGEIVINQLGNSSQTDPEIAATSDGGFVVTWTDSSNTNTADNSGAGVVARRFDMNGTAISDDILVNQEVSGAQDMSAVAALPNGDFVVVWESATSGTAGDGSGTGILMRVFGDAAAFVAPSASPDVEALSTARSFTESELNTAPQRLDADGAAAVSDMDSTDFDGGRLMVSLIQKSETHDDFAAQDNEGQFAFGLETGGAVSLSGSDVSVNGSIVGTIAQDGTGGAPLDIALNANATSSEVEILVEHLTLQNLSDDPIAQVTLSVILEDGDGGSSDPVLISVDITADQDGDGFIGTERQVNTVTVNAQTDSAIASLTDGGYVSVWTSTGQDSPGDTGVFGQRFDASGNAVGGEFQINSTTAQSQFDADVTGLTDGGWVVVWDDDTVTGVRLNRYDASGALIESETRVETVTTSSQFQPKVTGLDNGGYVVTWTSNAGASALDTNSNGVVGQLFNAAGARVGGEIAINQQTSGAQDTSEVTALQGGRFAVVWEENDVAGGDGSSVSVKARVFNSFGLAETPEFIVNSQVLSTQSVPRIATLSNGDFVVVWRSEGQDTSSGGIYYQRFSDAGVALGDEIRVNDYFFNDQTVPDIAALDTGGFVIGWTTTSTPAPGAGADVFVQVFDADGTRIDSEVRVNTEVASTQDQVRLTALPQGNYVVQWTSVASGNAGDGSGDGIFQQIIGDPAEIGQSEAPVFAGLDDIVTLAEDAANAGTLLVPEGGLTLLDSDSVDFDGGNIRISRVVTEPLQDQFTAPDNGVQDNLFVALGGAISQSGSTLRVNGVDVATISSDGAAGGDLVLDFLAGATPSAVELLLNALTYRNDSDDPRVSRTYSITINDGDGGVTAPRGFEIRVTDVAEAGAPERVGSENQVNSFVSADQNDPDVTVLADGGWVVVWTSDNEDGDQEGVYQQRYSADGVAIGGETKVNDTTLGIQRDAAVTALDDGGWVVVWESQNADGSTTDYGVLSQRFNVDGTAAGPERLVNTTVSNTQFDPDVATIPSGAAGFPNGGYVVVFSSDSGDGSGRAVLLQRYETDGTPVGGEIVANGTTSGTQDNASVLVLADGRMVVVYLSGTEVFARILNVDGTENTAEFSLGTNAAAPAIAGLADGGFVVTWNDANGLDGSGSGIAAQQFDATGAAVEGPFVVNEQTVGTQNLPSVTGLDDGRYVISWSDSNGTDGSSTGVFAQVYSATGVRLDSQFVVNEQVSGAQTNSVLAALPGGNFVANYISATSGSAGDGSLAGVFQQIFGDPADFAGGFAPLVEGVSRQASFDEAEVQAGFVRLDADQTIAFGDLDSANFDGGSLTLQVDLVEALLEQIAPGDNASQDLLGLVAGNAGNGDVQFTGLGIGDSVSVDGTTVGTITSVGQVFTVVFNASSTVEAVEAVLGNLGYSNLSDSPAADRRLKLDVTDPDGHNAQTSFIDVSVTEQIDLGLTFGEETQVNSFANSTQRYADVVELAGGGFVVAWSSFNQDTLSLSDSNYGIYSQTYDSAGRPVGRETLVNTTIVNEQQWPSIAATDDGGYVIVWQGRSQDNGADFDLGIIGQRFDATGAMVGTEFVVNTSVAQSQFSGNVAAFEGGGFVVAFASDTGDGNGNAILSQRFDVNGVPVGPETLVNTVNTTSNQTQPAVASLVDGVGSHAGHVIVFTSASGDGSSSGVFGQRFDATGAAVGPEFQVNTSTTGTQDVPSVAGLTSGGFVVSWADSATDGSSDGVFAQIYDVNGAPVGGEFRVTTDFINAETDPDVTAMSDGGFLISWTAGSTQDGSGDGVFAQRFAADGSRIDNEFQINSEFFSSQNQSAVTSFGDGFAAIWTSATDRTAGDGSGSGIFLRTALPVQPAATSPVINDLEWTTTLFADDVIATPQILDSNVEFTDPDSASLGGGQIDLYYTAGGTATDQLSVVAGSRVTLSGSGVFVDGAQIGTINATENGQNGANLVIDLIAAATPDAVELVIESLGYSSTDIATNLNNTSRGLGIRVTDGAGGQSEPDGIFVTISAGTNPNTGLVLNDWLQLQNSTSTSTSTPVREVAESALLTAPIIIDGEVDLIDFAGTGFDTGNLRVDEVNNGGTAGQLSVQDQGTGTGQIGFDGTNVSYEGTVIGTVNGTSNGVNGVELQIDLNANADAESVEALAEALTFGLSGALGGNTLIFDLSMTNGAGNTTNFNRGYIATDRDVSAFDDPPTEEQQVNSFTENEQTSPRVGALSDGGYVVAWTSRAQDDPQASSRGIYAQKYNDQGKQVGVEFLVNDIPFGDQVQPRVDGLSNGNYVILWRDDNGRDGSGQGIFGQVFQNDGTKVGTAFQVNEEFSSTQTAPDIVDLGAGRFLTVWASSNSGTAGDGNSTGVFARAFDANGQPEAGEFQVNFTTSGAQTRPRMVELPDGDAMIVWLDTGANDGSSGGVYAQRVANNGSLVSFDGTTPGADERLINTTTSGNQTTPEVGALSASATLPNGGFVFVWNSPDQSSSGIFAQIFDINGVAQGGEFQINTLTTSGQTDPVVVGLPNGGFAVAYVDANGFDGSGSGVFAQKFFADGSPDGQVFLVNEEISSTQYRPEIDVLANGTLVAVWASNTSVTAGDGNNEGVFQALFDQPAPAAGAMSPVLIGFGTQLGFAESDFDLGAQLFDQDGALSLTDLDSPDLDGGRVFLARIFGNDQVANTLLAVGDGPEQDVLGIADGNGVLVTGTQVSVNGTVIGTIVQNGVAGTPLEIVLAGAGATPEAVETLLAQLTYNNTSTTPLSSRSFALQIEDGDGGSTGTTRIDVAITPEVDNDLVRQGGEEQVNTYIPGSQYQPEASAVFDSAGQQIGFVSVWRSDNQDRVQDAGSGVFGQIFDLNGVPVGGEFLVTEHTESNQFAPAVIGLQTGGFVVAWEDQSGSNPAGQPIGETSTGVYARIFDETGTAQGSDFLINDQFSSTQSQVSLASRADGSFIAAYSDSGGADGSGVGVFMRDFDASGTALGPSLQVNTETSSTQNQPDVTVLSGGRTVVTWTSASSGTAGDTSGSGVFARVFEANGLPVTGEVLVNSVVAGEQLTPTVAELSDGGFVIAWRDDNGLDGSGQGIFQQRFDVDGQTVGSQVQVNIQSVSSQSDPDVIGLPGGGWVVSWSDSNSLDGNGVGVFGQRFAADGSRIDGPFQINERFISTQNEGRLVNLSGDAFAAVWTSNTSGVAAGDGEGSGVFSQVFGTTADVLQSDNPVLTTLAGTLTFDEAALNLSGQIIAPSAGVGDSDSADFAGGRLSISMVFNDVIQPKFNAPDDATQDQLSFDLSSDVSISGSDISVNGTLVGTLTSDGSNGAPLHVDLLAGATPASVQALIRAVSYANTSNDPEQSRLVAIQLSDGDGGSVRETVQISITPEQDGVQVVGDEVQTNAFTAGAQFDSQIAALTDGGYVITWTSNGQDDGASSSGIFAQRYDATGAPVGGEFNVNTNVFSTQSNAQVTGLSNGGFAIAWTDFSGRLGDDFGAEIALQVYDALGQKVGGEMAIDSPTNYSPDFATLAAFDTGEFLLAYQATDSTTNIREIRLQRYDDQGGAIGSEVAISPLASTNFGNPHIAVQSDGTYAVVFTAVNLDNPGDNQLGVFMQRMASDDSLIGGPIQVNTIETSAQYEPRIVATEGGGYVVAYRSDVGDDGAFFSSGIFYQQFDGIGNPVGVETLVNEVVEGSQFQPDVVALPGGGFAISYSDSNGTDGSGSGVFVQQYDAAGNRIDGALLVNQEVSSTQSDAAIASLGNGNFVVSYTSNPGVGAGDGDSQGIFHRIVGDPADFADGGAPVLDGVNAEVTYQENTLNGVPQLIDANGAAAVSDPDSADFDGGSILVSNVIASAPLIDQINAPDDLTQDQFGLRQDARVSITGTDVSVDGQMVASIVQDGVDGRPFELLLNSNAGAEQVEVLVEHLTYRNISDDPFPTRDLRIQITDGDGGASEPALVRVNITPTPDAATPVGGEQVVNTLTNGEDNPAVATLPGTDGDFIVVYESFGSDGNREGIYGQRFDVNGNKVNRDGSGLPSGGNDEFLINTTTTQDQITPQVEAFSDGGWVVVWTDDTLDTSGQGIVFQRFAPDGTPAGLETVANDIVTGTQSLPEVTVLNNDNFVITWNSDASGGSGDGSSTGVLARVFGSDGTPLAGQFVVNTESLSEQSNPSIAALNDGGFFITWQSFSSSGTADGDSYGVFGQRFDATGTALGGELQINTETRGSQYEPTVTVLEDGNLAIAWRDDFSDLSSAGVYAKVIAPDGTLIVPEFRVNDQRSSSQFDPVIEALDTGGFVIAWSDNSGADGSGTGVFAQQYNATGARIDSQFQVNTTTAGTQNQPDISALPGGGFVVTWNGSVLIQIYGNEAPSISPVSASGDEDTAIVLDAAIFDAGFVDPDGNTLQEIRIETFPTNGTLALSNSPVIAGQVISRADLLAGNLVYTGSQDFNGPDSFLWTGSDGLSFSNDPAVAANITVNPVNDAPGLEAGPNESIGEGEALNRTLTLTDPDLDTRTFTVDYGDGSSVETFDSAVLDPIINHAYAGEGTFTVTVTVDDNAGEANSIEVDSFDVTVVNANPVASNDFRSLQENDPAITGNVLDNDTDPGGDSLIVSAINGVAVDVNTQITLASGGLVTINADGSYSFDPNGAYEDLSRFQTFDEVITYEISDGEGGTDTAQFRVRITGENDAPVAQDDDVSVNDDSTLTGDVLIDNGNGPDSDVDQNTTFTIVELNGLSGDVGGQITLGSGALLTLNADGTFDYDPNGQFNGGGTDSFDYTLSDGVDTSTATVTVTINATNVAPVAQDDALAADEDTVATGSVLADNGNGADSDFNGDTLTVSEVNGDLANVGAPVSLSGGGQLTVQSDGTFSFDPNGQYEALASGETDTETFTYTIQDGNGGSDMATATITIAGVNDAPVVLNETLITDEDTSATGNVLANDTDPDTSDTLVVSEVGGSELALDTAVAGSTGGTFTISGNGNVTFDPGADFNALAAGTSTSSSVLYTVSDGNGGTNVARVFATINGVNDDPLAEDDAFSVGEDVILTGNVTLDNGSGVDSDPDTGDIPFVSAVNGLAGSVGSQISLASGALLTVNGSGTFTYDPNGQFENLGAGDVGSDSFTYVLRDSGGLEDTATVAISILGDNDSPVGVGDFVVTDEDSSASGNVLLNDGDADGDVLFVSAVNGEAADVDSQVLLASGALLTLNADGSFDYDPNGAFEDLAVTESDTDSFTYTVSDGNGGSDTVTATVTIDGVNDAPFAGDDTVATDEETALTAIDLFANNGGGADSDPDTSDTLTITEVNGVAANVGATLTLASGGVLTVDADGGAAYDPNGSFESLSVGRTQLETFTYTISDGNGGTDTATGRIIINGVNDAPVAADDVLNVGVDAALNGNVLDNNGNGPDSDVDSEDTLSVTALNGAPGALGVATTLGSGATVTLNANGTFSYAQNGIFSGLGVGATANDSFTYTISDGNGGTDTAVVNITIGGTNLPPVAVDDAESTDEDTAFTTGSVLANDTDGNSDTLSVVALDDTGTTGLVTDNDDGTFDYDPNGQFEDLRFGEIATDSFSYTVGDGNGGADTATVTVTINGVNDAPVGVDDVIVTDEDTAGSVVATANDSDVEGTDLSVLSLDLTGVLGTVSVAADGDTILYDPAGQFESLGVGAVATETFSYTVSDGDGGTDTAQVTVTINGVNDAPVAADDALVTDEDTALSGSVLADNGAGADADVDLGDVLQVTEVNGASAAVGSGITLASGAVLTLNADGSFDYDPNGQFETLGVGETDTDSFTYTLSDGNAGTDTATANITINGVNDAPVAADDVLVTDEDTALAGNVLSANGGDADADIDANDTISVLAVNGAGANVDTQITLASGALLTLNANGTFNYDPNGQFESLGVGETDADSFTYTISDGNGGTDTATASITIDGVNDSPVGVGDFVVTDEDSSASGNVLLNDGDADGDVLFVSAVNGEAADVDSQVLLASGALLTLNADGSFDYDPNGAFEDLAVTESDTDSFTYTVSDGNGGSDTVTATVTIDGVNDAPFAGDDTVATDEETALTAIDLFANNGGGADSDPDTSDTLTITEVNGVAANVGATLTLASGGVLTVDADGGAAYDPNGSFESLSVGRTQLETFTYTISDGNGGTDTATGRIIINGVNDAPVAADDVLNVGVDAALNGNVLDNNGNGPDSDVDSEDTLSVTALNGAPGALGVATTLGSGATVTLNANGTFSYAQNGIFSGLGVGATANDSFTYTISDGNGGTDTAVVNITIGGTNLPPVAVDDAESTDEDTAFTTGSVLANDTDGNSDTLSVVALDDTGTTGLVTDNDDGTFDYDPNGQFEDLRFGEIATDSFSYTVGDGNGGADTATVTVTINGVNDAPVGVDDVIVTDEDTAGSVVATANDSDVEGTDLSVLSLDLTGVLGTVSVAADGDTILYDPAGQFESLGVGAVATETFSYTVSDGDGGTDTAQVTVTINGVNDAPVAADDALVTDEDTALSGSVLADNGAGADADVDLGDVLQVTEVNGASAAVGSGITLASGAVLTLNADGSFDYDPNGQFETLGVGETDTDSFTYTLSDGNAGTDTATANITINGVNDAPELAGTGPFDVLENTTDVGVITATDVEGDGLTYAIIGGADETLFKIDPTSGSLRFLSAPDFESPGSADGDNSYEVQVAVFDGRDTDDAFVFVDVLDEDENTGPNVVLGTPDSDTLTGTNDADLVRSLGGPFDVMTGLGGADVFEIANTVGNGMEIAYITDYEVGLDAIDLGGAQVQSSLSAGGSTYLYLNYTDFDIVIVQGANSVGDISLV